MGFNLCWIHWLWRKHYWYQNTMEKMKQYSLKPYHCDRWPLNQYCKMSKCVWVLAVSCELAKYWFWIGMWYAQYESLRIHRGAYRVYLQCSAYIPLWIKMWEQSITSDCKQVQLSILYGTHKENTSRQAKSYNWLEPFPNTVLWSNVRHTIFT